MRVLLLTSALTLAAAGAANAQARPIYPPIPDINVALVFDGREVAADTTDEDGYAEFPAPGRGDHGVSLQEDVPVNAGLAVKVGEEEWTTRLTAGMGVQPAIEVPARPGDMVMVRLVSLNEDWTPPEDELEPVESRAESPLGIPGHDEVNADAADGDLDGKIEDPVNGHQP